MRVALNLSFLVPGETGGMEVYARELARALAAREDVELVLLANRLIDDGWPDVLVTQHGGVRLFLNNGNGTFTDATEASQLKNPLWGTSAGFVDYDRDGWLDLVIVNYLADDPNWRPRQAADRSHDMDWRRDA